MIRLFKEIMPVQIQQSISVIQVMILLITGQLIQLLQILEI
jgi:hypothetical protein